MRQILIANSAKALNAGYDSVTGGANDLSKLQAGALAFFELGSANLLAGTAAPTKNFAIALGRANNRPFIIPEVDLDTLRVVHALPKKGNQFTASFTMPTTVVGKEYTLRFFKKGVVPHERNSWTVSIVAATTTAATEAGNLVSAINNKTSEKFGITATASTTTVTITGSSFEDWEVVGYDELKGTSISITSAKKHVGDKAFIADLASQCAAGKGFNHTYGEGKDYIPGYPEPVEDLTPNTSGTASASTSGYKLYTLRFKVGRDASKTRDERVWQEVYVAAPIDSNGTTGLITALDLLLPEGNPIHNTLADHEERIETLEA